MPRAKNEIDVSDDTRAMELAAKQQNEKEMSVQDVDSMYLPDGESYNLFVCMSRAKDAEELAGRAFIELGQQLALIKAHESSEQFHAAMDSLNISWRTANYAMAAARKFSNSQLIANLNRTSLIALTVLDDDDAQDLVNGEEVTGLGNLDDVAQMTVKELKKALRELRNERTKAQEEHAKQLEAVEEVVRRKEGKISELEMELAGRQPPTKEELAQKSLEEIRRGMAGKLATMSATLDELSRLLMQAQETDSVTIDQLQSLSDGVAEFYSLFDDKYQDFNQDMENIRPMKRE